MNINKELITFLKDNPTCFQVINSIRNQLIDAGYTELIEGKSWSLQPNNQYFVVRNESSIIAFQIPNSHPTGFMITASHSDSPTFKIKENPEIKANGYVRLNVEKYGGMLMSPWLDRPLSVAGRIIVKEGQKFITKSVVVDKDLLMIPNLAIHMNHSQNEGVKWNVQKDLLPILGDESASGNFMKIIAESANVDVDNIVGHDLFLYIREEGKIWGANQEYLSAPHLDDLQCSFANLKGFLNAKPTNSIPMMVIFDNEEVGSATKQGADSTFLSDVIERITFSLSFNTEEKLAMISNSFMVSADNAHALHPAHTDVADPVNKPFMNQGIVIKYNANQRYTSDGVSAAVFKSICDQANVPYQQFTNNSNVPGGSTLGNISNAHISLNAVDIGLPQLAMHSPYETAGTKDTQYLIDALTRFFSSSFIDEGQGNWTLK